MSASISRWSTLYVRQSHDGLNKGNNKITELREILQRESQ
jgi:hypothetical protein